MSEFWIQCRSGKAFDLLHPTLEAIDIEDVAWSLAFQCRFNGHVRKFYSVAEHSVRVARRLAHAHPEHGAALVLYGLLHDAAEAYVGDAVLPLKQAMRRSAGRHVMRRESRSAFDEIEGEIAAAIFGRFGLSSIQRAGLGRFVHVADLELLATEKRDLMGPGERMWPDLGVEPLPEKIHPLRPAPACTGAAATTCSCARCVSLRALAAPGRRSCARLMRPSAVP